jgi:hypothetical protein
MCDQSINKKNRWMLGTFKPHNSVGTDEIIPPLLQQEVEYLYHTYACMACGFVPMVLRKVRVMFIPKPREADYTQARACCPASLLYFLLGTMEKLFYRHHHHHVYQTGKSLETCLRNVTTPIENATEHKDIALGAFLDIGGAFDRASFDTIKQWH